MRPETRAIEATFNIEKKLDAQRNLLRELRLALMQEYYPTFYYAPPVGGRKPCPNCGELIPRDSLAIEYDGEVFHNHKCWEK